MGLQHTSGARQSAVLQTPVGQLEDSLFDNAGKADAQSDLPSPRFPIVPCLLRNNLPPDNRIFVYSTVPINDDAKANGEGSDRDSEASAPEQRGDSASDMGEDWQSVGASEGEPYKSPRDTAASRTTPMGKEFSTHEVQWRRAVVESSTLLRRVLEPPFRCFPKSLS